MKLAPALLASLVIACAPDPVEQIVGGPFDAGGNSGRDGGGALPDLGSLFTADRPAAPLDVPAVDVTRADVPRDVVNVYRDTPTPSDAPRCATGPACSPRADGCGPSEVCNDGLDNNCDGRVDESCPCLPGAVQRCFAGPPGRRGQGACSDGQQTCRGTGEFGTWGDCMGGISPGAEVCDNLDNDCNGCRDEGLCCNATGTCPAPGDPRIPTGTPFSNIAIRGRMFGPDATTFRWRVVGGPCDQMLFDTSQRVTYSLNNPSAAGGNTLEAQGENLLLRPTLSGDYTVTLTMTFPGGRTLSCTFIVPVRAPGFRAELCWDTTGRDDVDFWVHDPRNTNPWIVGLANGNNTCGYWNCRNRDALNWGYAPTAGGACREPDAMGRCNSPRLDIDNIVTAGVPENINVDAPRANETFRVAVNYYDGTARPSPMVNIYCGGALRATYGGYTTRAGARLGAEPVARFTRSGEDTSGTLWRVADVTMTSAEACRIQALHPRGASAGYCVDTSTDRSFLGPCVVGR